MKDASANGSVFTGSPAGDGNDSGNGQIDLSQYVSRSEYDQLFTKLGEMGREKGEKDALIEKWQEYGKQTDPIVEKLGQNPEVYKALVEGKLTDEIGKAVLEGKITLKQADAIVDKAAATVSDAGGTIDPDQFEARVIAKAEEMFEKKFGKVKSDFDEFKATSALDREIDDFISVTPDVAQYSDKIQEFLDAHPEMESMGASAVKNAYLIIKGQEAMELRAAEEQKANAENGLNAALNVGGAGGAGNLPVFARERVFGESHDANRWAS